MSHCCKAILSETHCKFHPTPRHVSSFFESALFLSESHAFHNICDETRGQMEWVKHCLTLKFREWQQKKVKRERKCKSLCSIPPTGEGSCCCCHSYSPVKPHRDEKHERLSQASTSSLIAIVPQHFLLCFPLLPHAAGQETKVRSFPHYEINSKCLKFILEDLNINTFTTECVF